MNTVKNSQYRKSSSQLVVTENNSITNSDNLLSHNSNTANISHYMHTVSNITNAFHSPHKKHS